jgi:hypothetical protein
MCFIPSSAGAESQPLCRAAPWSDPVLGESSTRCSSKRSPTREAKWLTLSRKATRSYFGGTHRGEFFGRPGTGNHIEWTAIHIYIIRDGKILEDAVMTDSLAIMQQIGLARKAWPATKQAEKY